jgi:peptidoglycan/xylan/chitin deacetylase (PgdA/CDA1 family)
MSKTTAPPPRVARRALLALGAAALLPGCAATSTTSSAPEPLWLPTGAPPSPSPAPSMPASACPTDPAVLEKPGNPQQYLPCEGMNIALTVDDGPHPVWTPKVLALLARYDVRATFFVVGRNAAANTDLIASIVDDGHHIANHTFTHPMDLPALTPGQIRAEIERACDTIVDASGGSQPRLFRAPGGNWSTSVISACTSAGMRPLDWSVDTRDWSRPGVEHIVQTILTKTKPGAIILDHDGGGNRQQTVDALGIALPRLIDAGYHFTQP